MVMLEASGTAPGRAGAALTLAVIDKDKRIVSSQRLAVQPDDSFAASMAVFNLAAADYRFVVVTATTPPAALAGGRFTVAGGAAPQPFQAQTIQPYAAETVKPYSGQPVQPPPAQPRPPESAGGLFRTFGLAIPGVAYTTDNYATNTRTVTVSSGVVTKSAVRVNPDGTFIWNSAWDGKIIQGHWRADRDGIVLLKAQSGLDWKMQRMAQPAGKAVITLWDQNSIWYHGTPLD